MRRIGMAVQVLLVIALVGLPAGVQAQGDADGLVAQWHFDEGAGSVLVDSSGNGNDGVIYGATWVEGKYGGALRFDGVDDYVEVSDSSSMRPDQLTVEFWLKPDVEINFKSKFHGFLIKSDNNANTIGEGWFLGYWKGAIGWWTSVSTTWHGPSHNTNLESGNWYHIVGTYDKSVYKLYINGIEVVSKIDSTSITYDDSPVWIGRAFSNDGNIHFNGIIDEVRIYNSALTAEEIKQHYEGEQTAISLTKSATPHPIKQGQTTTVTLTVKNTGTTEITDIEVSDIIPTDLAFVNGETSKTYASLRPDDSREFHYVLQPSDAGTFNLNPATATYSDEAGNYHTTESETATITVIPSTDQPPTPHTTKKPSTEISTASVHLHGEKTDVVLGEDVLLKLSAVNIIGNPLMRVQVIIIPPSGWSVTSSAFAKTGAGQYTTTYDIESGVGRDIEVRIMPNQIGDDFQVQGRIIYYFGDDSDAREDHALALPITVRAEAEPGAEQTADTPESDGGSAPGFAAVVAVIGLLVACLWRKEI